MSAAVAPPHPPGTTDRSDFRTVLTAGTRLGLGIAAAVIVYLLSARNLPVGGVRSGVETLVVLAAGTAATFLPGTWCVARSVEGIAGAAAIGLWGTIVFAIVDIALLRPLHAYPWTWDAVGGGTTWWYLPMWWILGTFLAWMGGTRIALRAARGGGGAAEVSVPRTAGPVLIGALVAIAFARATGVAVLPPVAAGVGFAVTLVALVLVALARRA